MQVWRVVYAAIIIGASAMTAQLACATVQSVPLLCTVSGAKLLDRSISAGDVCNKVAAGLSRKMGKPVKRVAEITPVAKASGQWLEVNIRLSRPGVATTSFAHRLNGRKNLYPDFSIAVSDRPLDAYVIDQVILELAKKLKG
jgi:hypothetical protein